MYKNTRLFAEISSLRKKYEIIKEEDENDTEPFPTGEEETDENETGTEEGAVENAGQDPTQAGEVDPTITPEDESVPENENGSYISDTKLAMLVSVLAKAATSNPINIPSDMLPVTAQNAYEIVQYIENQLQVDDSQNKIENSLGKI